MASADPDMKPSQRNYQWDIPRNQAIVVWIADRQEKTIMASKKTPNQKEIDVDTKDSKSGGQEEDLDLSDFANLAKLIYTAEKVDHTKPQIVSAIRSLIRKNQISSKYRIVFLYDPVGDIAPYTADRIYSALPKDANEDILLIIHSSGGRIEPAYLISKCCKEYSNRFVVSIPRRAKSAAALISLGADEIHMGTMSELGPIDPQFGGLPALGLSSAVEYLAGVCKKYPDSSDMFAKYLSLTLDLRTLGYFERVSESAMQYAQRLLQGKRLPEGQDIHGVAEAFVYTYKDHSFVIDKDEATTFLGDTIKINSPEYDLGNEVHNFLDRVNLFAGIFKNHSVSIVGTCDDLMFREQKDS